MTVTLWTYFFYTYSQDREDEEVEGLLSLQVAGYKAEETITDCASSHEP